MQPSSSFRLNVGVGDGIALCKSVLITVKAERRRRSSDRDEGGDRQEIIRFVQQLKGKNNNVKFGNENYEDFVVKVEAWFIRDYINRFVVFLLQKV